MALGGNSNTRAYFQNASFAIVPFLLAMEDLEMGGVIVANELKDLIGPVTTKAGVQFTGAALIRIRLELDGDVDDGREWNGTAWVVSPASVAATSLGNGRHLYQLPITATAGKLGGRIVYTFTDDLTEASATTISPTIELLISDTLGTLEILHFDLDASANPNGGTYNNPLGGGNPPTELVTRMNAREGAKIAFLKGESDFIRPTTGDWTNKIFEGSSGVYVGIDPNDVDFNGSVFRRMAFQSTVGVGFGAPGAGFGGITAEVCQMLGPLTFNISVSMYDCQLATTSSGLFTLVPNQDLRFVNCSQFRVSGLNQPCFLDFNSAASTRAIFHRYSGAIIARNMTQASAFLDVDGRYDVTVESNCSAGTIRIRGSGIISVVAGALVTIQDERYESGERIDLGPILLDSGDIEATAILMRHGKIISNATSATITINDNAGVLVYTETIATPPNAGNGGYKFGGTPVSPITQGTYTVLMSITDPLSTVASQVEIIGAP